ncbi:MAG: hypothetical protein ACRDBJ_01610 [Plesiomonas shigelloides]
MLFLNGYLSGALSCRFFATVLAVTALRNTFANEKREIDSFDLNFKSKLSNSRFSLTEVFQLAATAKTVAKKRQDKAPNKYPFKNKKINVSFWRHE